MISCFHLVGCVQIAHIVVMRMKSTAFDCLVTVIEWRGLCCVAACLRIVRDRAVSSSPAGVVGQLQQAGAQPVSTGATGNARNQLNKPASGQSPVSKQASEGHGKCNGPTSGHRNIKVRICISFWPIMLACPQVDSAFYPPWDSKMSTSQRAVILCSWDLTAGLVESNGSLPPGGWLKSLASWLPVHWDQLRSQRSITSMGSLYLFCWLVSLAVSKPEREPSSVNLSVMIFGWLNTGDATLRSVAEVTDCSLFAVTISAFCC